MVERTKLYNLNIYLSTTLSSILDYLYLFIFIFVFVATAIYMIDQSEINNKLIEGQLFYPNF